MRTTNLGYSATLLCPCPSRFVPSQQVQIVQMMEIEPGKVVASAAEIIPTVTAKKKWGVDTDVEEVLFLAMLRKSGKKMKL